MLTVSSCYSSCGEKGTGTGTVCGMGTWTSRRRRRTRTRTCPGTCHTTHSWSGRRSCANTLSGTWGEERDSSAPSPPCAQHQVVLGNRDPHPPQSTQGEPGYGNTCPSLPGDAKAPQRHCSAWPQHLQPAGSSLPRHSLQRARNRHRGAIQRGHSPTRTHRDQGCCTQLHVVGCSCLPGDSGSGWHCPRGHF